jgi:hypothetical protein
VRVGHDLDHVVVVVLVQVLGPMLAFQKRLR